MHQVFLRKQILKEQKLNEASKVHSHYNETNLQMMLRAVMLSQEQRGEWIS